MPASPLLTKEFTEVATDTQVMNFTRTIKVPKDFAIAVKKDHADVSAWAVKVLGSLDGVNFTELGEHTQADNDGKIKWFTSKPVLYVKLDCTTLTLGVGGTKITVQLLAL